MSGEQSATSGHRPRLSPAERAFCWGVGIALLGTVVGNPTLPLPDR